MNAFVANDEKSKKRKKFHNFEVKKFALFKFSDLASIFQPHLPAKTCFHIKKFIMLT